MSDLTGITRKQELPLKGENTSLFLEVIIAIAVFIFAITLSGVLAVDSMVDSWNKSILGSITVQIMPVNDTNKEKAQSETLAYEEKAVEFLKSLNGVLKVTPLTDKQLEELLQPWLGDGVNIADLPAPRIIDVKIAPDAEIDFQQLSKDLAVASPQASLDNHKLWLNKLIAFADGLKLIALTVLVLISTITSGAIFYTTQMSLGLHHNIIEILHIVGAKDTYVAQQYAKRMAFLGFLGGLFGLFLAIPAIFFIGKLATAIEGGIINDASLEIVDWAAIFALPVFSMLIAMLTAYYTVKRTLKKLL
jgi:cell division transport system permease protein